METNEKGGPAMTSWSVTDRGKHRKATRIKIWNRFVLIVGYGTILYALARGVVYVLVLLGGQA